MFLYGSEAKGINHVSTKYFYKTSKARNPHQVFGGTLASKLWPFSSSFRENQNSLGLYKIK